jgi:hypothetical protein
MLPAKYRVCVPREQYAADKAGAGTTLEKTAPISRPRPHEGAALPFSKSDYKRKMSYGSNIIGSSIRWQWFLAASTIYRRLQGHYNVQRAKQSQCSAGYSGYID